MDYLHRVENGSRCLRPTRKEKKRKDTSRLEIGKTEITLRDSFEERRQSPEKINLHLDEAMCDSPDLRIP